MALTYVDGLKDFAKAEEMYRVALDGYERSLGKDHEYTKSCAENMAQLLEWAGRWERWERWEKGVVISYHRLASICS